MAYIRTLLRLLVGLRLFGVSQSSTESSSRALQTANDAAIQPSRVFSLLYLRLDNNRIPKTTVEGEKSETNSRHQRRHAFSRQEIEYEAEPYGSRS